MKTKNSKKDIETAKYVREVRALLKITQAEFGKRIGKKRDNIAKYENGDAVPPGDILLKIQDLHKNYLWLNNKP